MRSMDGFASSWFACEVLRCKPTHMFCKSPPPKTFAFTSSVRAATFYMSWSTLVLTKTKGGLADKHAPEDSYCQVCFSLEKVASWEINPRGMQHYIPLTGYCFPLIVVVISLTASPILFDRQNDLPAHSWMSTDPNQTSPKPSICRIRDEKHRPSSILFTADSDPKFLHVVGL